MSPTVKFIVVVIIGILCTFTLRAFPFIIFGDKRPVPKIVRYLGKILPPAVMAVLVIYCVRNIGFDSPGSFVPSLAAIAVTVILHLWKKNTFLSIFCGTACYMILVQLVFKAV